MPRLSVLVRAPHEEKGLAACLQRLGFADELVVALDRRNGRQAEIALRFADRVVFAASATDSLTACGGDWIFEIGPDEMVGEALAEEIRFVVDSAITTNRFLVPVETYAGRRLIPDDRKDCAPGRWLYRRGAEQLSTDGWLINTLIRPVDVGRALNPRRLLDALRAALRAHLTLGATE